MDQRLNYAYLHDNDVHYNHDDGDGDDDHDHDDDGTCIVHGRSLVAVLPVALESMTSQRKQRRRKYSSISTPRSLSMASGDPIIIVAKPEIT